MNEASHRVRVGDGWIDLPVASMGGEALVVANVAALVSQPAGRDRILLQRRDKQGEAVRGRLEVPMGRWRAGETPEEAVTREVEEETGLRVKSVEVTATCHQAAEGRPFLSLAPVVVTVGVAGAYPALHLAFRCTAEGEPRALPGETADPGWYGREELEAMLEDPSRFTGPTLAILQTLLGHGGRRLDLPGAERP